MQYRAMATNIIVPSSTVPHTDHSDEETAGMLPIPTAEHCLRFSTGMAQPLSEVGW